MLSFARFALDSIVRNRRRTLYAILGVTLAVSLIAGSLIAIDSASFGLLRERLDGLPVDFYGQSYAGDLSSIDVERYEEVTDRLLTVDGVQEVSYVVSCSGWALLNSDGVMYQGDPYYWYPSGSFVFLPSDSSVILDRYKIEGEAPSPGTVAIPSSVATALDLSVGAPLICSYQVSVYDEVNFTYVYSYVNISLEVSQIWTQEGVTEDYWQWWYSEAQGVGDVQLGGVYNPVVMPMESASMVVDPVSEVTLLSCPETYLVWVDRGEYANIVNIALSIDRLETLNGRLERAASEVSARFSCPVVQVLFDLGSDLSQKKLAFIGLSLPVVVLGVYLSVVGVEMGMTERRREIGVLKSRGAGNGQIFASLVMESMLLGAVAGFLGLATGFLISRFLLVPMSTLYESEAVSTATTSFFISHMTIAVVVLFGILLMLLSSYKPMRRASRMAVAEALHQYTPKTVKVEYRSRYDIAALVFVGYSIACVFWLRQAAPYWSGGSFVAYLLFSVTVIAGSSFVPAIPFLLSVSIIRLVTRGSRRLYTRFSWIVSRWTKELHYIVEKNIARNPKRASNIGIIVSLAVAFGLFVSITMESELAHAEKVVLYEVGADIRYNGYCRYNETGFYDVDYSVLGTMDSVDGVDKSVMVREQSVNAEHSYASMAIFDTEAFADLIEIGSGWYVGDGSHDITDLGENGTVFINEDFADANYLVVGDTIEASMDVYPDHDSVGITVSAELRVVGVLKQLPGMSNNLYVDSDTLSFIEPDWYGGYNIIRFFVMVEEGADPSEVADGVLAWGSSAGLEGWVEVTEERLEEAMAAPEFRTLRDFLYMEYALSIVMLTCGVGLVLFVTVWDRRNELACILARGSSPEQMRRILMGESISLMTLGLVVGSSAGLLSAYLYGVLMDGFNSSEIPHDLVFSWISWVVVLSAIASFMLASFLATYNAGRIKLAEALRIRGG